MRRDAAALPPRFAPVHAYLASALRLASCHAQHCRMLHGLPPPRVLSLGPPSRQRTRRHGAASRLRSRASLTPHEVLGVQVGASAAEIKFAFRAKLKKTHPDVNASADAAEATLRLVRAFELLSSEAAAGFGEQSGDPFSEPDGEASDVFVNELRCQGRACSSCCVDKAPQVFQFADDTGAARATDWRLSGVRDYDMRVAVGQCPTECIHWVTPRQRAVLDAELLSAREGRASLDEVGERCAELLARARFENGRERGPKRTPKASTQYVDWY